MQCSTDFFEKEKLYETYKMILLKNQISVFPKTNYMMLLVSSKLLSPTISIIQIIEETHKS